jgi:1,4-alpha-glucan branching enzyme
MPRPNPGNSRAKFPRQALSESASENSSDPFFLKAKTLNKNELRMKTQLFQNNGRITGNRMTQFAFPAATARQVFLAGDFNNWDTKAGPMHKGPDGVWHLGVALKPGRYEYRFFADEVWCDDPAAQQMARNYLGTANCVRNV